MALLKGQNFRVLVPGVVAGEDEAYKVIAQATTCTITLNNETEDEPTKDDTGMSSMPTITSKSWSVQVESLDVTDIGPLLAYVHDNQPLTIVFDEVAKVDNQTMAREDYCRKGVAYIGDLTFNFNDRETTVKNIQFQGTGALEVVGDVATQVIPVETTRTKGQFVRLFVSPTSYDNSNVIAACKTLSFHLSVSFENSTTKDTAGNWQQQTPTAISYDISTSALIASNDVITSTVPGADLDSLMTYFEDGELIFWKICNTSGENNRTIDTVIVRGRAYITQLSINAPNRADAVYNATLTGRGRYLYQN